MTTCRSEVERSQLPDLPPRRLPGEVPGSQEDDVMTIGPQTEAGPAVVPQRPTTEAERLEWLVRLCEGLVMSPRGWTTSKLRDALAPAVRAWTAEALGVSAAERESERETRDDLIEALERLNDCRKALGLPDGTTGEVLAVEVRAMAGRIAQLEEALAKAHEDLEAERKSRSLAELVASDRDAAHPDATGEDKGKHRVSEAELEALRAVAGAADAADEADASGDDTLLGVAMEHLRAALRRLDEVRRG